MLEKKETDTQSAFGQKKQKPSVYTVTLNPSLDYIVSVEDFRMGETNRTAQEQILPGGKGINVSTVLSHLGIANTALGLCAGFVGEEIERRIAKLGFSADFIHLKDGCSRINVKLKNYEGTEINGSGPVADSDAQLLLLEKLDSLLPGDVIVLAGSIPSGMPDTVYSDILGRLEGREVLAVVDTAGKRLLHTLPYRPFLVKPNQAELGELFDVEIKTREEAARYAGCLREQGAVNVLVSMGGAGAVLAAGDGQMYELDAPKGKVINTVGAGDSMVAGFLAGWLESQDYSKAFRLGVCAGSASAFSEMLATKEEILALYEARR